MLTQCTQYVPLTLYSTVRHMYYLYLHYYYILVHFFVIVFFNKQIGVSLSINVTHFTERRDEKITPANTHTHTRACQHSVFVFVILFLLVKIILGHFKFLCRYVLNERHSSTLTEKKINPQLVARKIPQKSIKHSKRYKSSTCMCGILPTHPPTPIFKVIVWRPLGMLGLRQLPKGSCTHTESQLSYTNNRNNKRLILLIITSKDGPD